MPEARKHRGNPQYAVSAVCMAVLDTSTPGLGKVLTDCWTLGPGLVLHCRLAPFWEDKACDGGRAGTLHLWSQRRAGEGTQECGRFPPDQPPTAASAPLRVLCHPKAGLLPSSRGRQPRACSSLESGH